MTRLMKCLNFVFKVLSLPLQLMQAFGFCALYNRFFPFLMYRISLSYNKKMNDKKVDLFCNLSDFKKTSVPLTILEIGCGSGANFKFYPPGCKVICTDPNPNFQKYIEKSMGHQNDHISLERFVVAPGEDMGLIEDESVDVVVVTLVLCSVNNIPRTLQEAHRMLRPGGAFYFLEHVAAEPTSWTYFFQYVLHPLWYQLCDGCQLTRTTWNDLEAAGFSELKLRHIEAPICFLVRPHIMGYAVK